MSRMQYDQHRHPIQSRKWAGHEVFPQSGLNSSPPRNGAPLTESNLPLQHGKVFIVTGASSGLGYELTRILYGAGGNVYMLTGSRENAEAAAARIKASYSDSGIVGPARTRGTIEFIEMDLMDLHSVKRAAQAFQSRESRLNILFNNAGTGARKDAPLSAQGHEYHFSINVLGGFLLTRLLNPTLSQTARNLPPNSVRVVWPASILVEMMSPKTGINPRFLEDPRTAAWFLASEFARRQSSTNTPVVFIAGNLGNYVTNIWRHTPALLYYILRPILRNPVHGAEIYLWMAFSESVTGEEAQAGAYAICDGRWHPAQRSDLVLALRTFAEGGSGRASELFDWCEARVEEFV
ncbi:hypothetical protein GGR58DRAFT_520086 [Xylaria digitata]|nr:hypothetical protein GGR58DRAFT_520086 [Xylaria digitata]